MAEKRKTGTREWAEVNLNIVQGCEHGCRYCYARQNALRFNRIASVDEWPTVVVDRKKVEKGYGLRAGKTIMFPTAHDITPAIIDDCITVLRKVLDAGNRVLIVSKPHKECIKKILDELSFWKEQVLFRFTIGADDNGVLTFWEPNAPAFNERLACLKMAFKAGWETSVSIEPMLDPPNIDRLVKKLLPFTSETIWIGKMNKIRLRAPDVDEVIIEALEKGYTDEKILALVRRLGSNPKIEWKDSIKLVIERNSRVL